MSMLKNSLNQVTLSKFTPPPDLIGLRRIHQRSSVLATKNAKFDQNSHTESLGIMAEVFYQGHYAYASTSDLSQQSIQRAVDRAYALAQASSAYKVFSFSKEVRPSFQYKKQVSEKMNPIRVSEKFDFLAQSCQWMKTSDRIKETNSALLLDEIEQEIVNTNGAEIEQKFNLYAFYADAIAQQGSETQRRSFHGGFALSRQAFSQNKILSDISKAATHEALHTVGVQALELLEAPQCPTTTTDLILMPDQMLLQIHESIGHPLELDRILGDEQNYAGCSFVKSTDFGKMVYGSPLLTVSFNPEVANEYASYAFDETGSQAKKEFLIKEGILLRGLGSLESAERLNVPSVACARAESWNRPPIDRMANINLESGNSTLEEMIAQTESGVLMESNRSWSIDDYRLKFQFGCEYAQEIKNGKITRTLKNPNYRGITPQFWGSLVAVGNEETKNIFGSPFCGKGEPNQIIRVGHASPPCLFKNIEVFGG